MYGRTCWIDQGDNTFDNKYDKQKTKNEFKDIEFDELDKLRNANKTSKDKRVNVMKNINNIDRSYEV